MGIDVRIEAEGGEVERELSMGDHLNWLLSLRPLDDTVCLRFIDSYGNTVFNIVQLPVLRAELVALRDVLTDHNVEASKAACLDRLQAYRRLPHLQRMPPDVADDWDRHVAFIEAMTRAPLESTLTALLGFVDDAIRLGSHHYVKFIGD